MKLNRKNKKGFTIVELVIVVAVIGILSAVLIPTFINLTNRANEASDQSLVKNLNTALATQEADPNDKKNNTLHDAVEDLKAYGYILENLAPKSDKAFVWDSQTNRFVFTDDSSVTDANKHQFFSIQKDATNNGFSIYAGPEFSATSVDINGIGFDAGYKDNIATVNYTNTTGNAHDVVIRTNGGTAVEIDAATDSVKHYNMAGKVKVTRTYDSSYHEFGTVGLIEVNSGRVVAENGSKINTIVLSEKAAGGDLAGVVEIKSGASVENKYAANTSVIEANNSKTNSYQFVISGDNKNSDLIVVPEGKTYDQVVEERANEAIHKVVPFGISNYEELVAAFSTGGLYYLKNDVTMLQAAPQASSSVTIDFNGHSIVIGEGALTDVNHNNCMLSIDGEDNYLTFNDSVGSGSLVYANAGDHSDAVIGTFGGATLVVNGGAFLSASDYLIGGVATSVIFNGGKLHGKLSWLADSTLTVTVPMEIHITNDMLPFTYLGNTIIDGTGITHSITGTGWDDPETIITFSRI